MKRESEMVKKPQLKRLPRKKFDTDTELSGKNVRVQSTFTFSVVKCWKCCPWCVIHACGLSAIDPRTFEKISRSSRIWTLLPRLVQLVLLTNLSAGYRPAVLNAPIQKDKNLNPEILAVLLVEPPAGNDLCHDLPFLDGTFLCLTIRL
jgi:hypothetical protein